MENVEEITIIDHIETENDINYENDGINVNEEDEIQEEKDEDPDMDDITSILNRSYMRKAVQTDESDEEESEEDEEEEEKFENESCDSNGEFTPENSDEETGSESGSEENSDLDEEIQKIKRSRSKKEKIKFEPLSEHYAYRFIHKLLKYMLEKESKTDGEEYIYKVYDEDKTNSAFYGLMNNDKLFLMTRLDEEVDILLLMFLFEAIIDNNYGIFDMIRERIYESSLDDIDEKKICHIDWMKKVSGYAWLNYISESNCLMGLDIMKYISDHNKKYLMEQNEYDEGNLIYSITDDMSFYTIQTLCELSYDKVRSSRR